MADVPPVRVTVEPDTHRFATMLRVFAGHLLAAADDIEKDDMTDDPSPAPDTAPDTESAS